MSIYSVDKLISETRRIASEYRKATGKILPVTPEIAINDAINILKLKPNNDSNSSFDAMMEINNQSLRVQIKGRAVFNEKRQGHRLGQLKLEQDWDAVILVIMNEEFMPQEIYLASRDIILDEISADENENKKGAMTIAKFKIIADLLWTEDAGFIENNIWTNQE
ncbi:MAG: hypothetical protein AAF410_05160 [Pseudomonadota bacterium]